MGSLNIFVSYNSKNRKVVKTLVNDLQGMGHDVWLDTEGITGGHDWWARILEAIRNCDLFIPILTTRYFASEPCKTEIEYARALNKRILPLSLAQINHHTLPSYLQKIHVTDYQHSNKEQLLDLVKALNGLPKVLPLPEPLPEEPATPLPSIALLRDQIDNLPVSLDRQRIIIVDLKDLTEDEAYDLAAWELLEILTAHDNLLEKASRELSALIQNRPSDLALRRRVLNLEPRTFEGHTKKITGVAFSPDAKYVLSASDDFTAKLWDSITGQVVQTISEFKDVVTSVAFSPDGKYYLAASNDGNVKVWLVETNELITSFLTSSPLVGADFAANTSIVIVLHGYKKISVCDIESGQVVNTDVFGTNEAVFNCAFSQCDDLVFAGGSYGFGLIYNFKTGMPFLQLHGHSGHITCSTFSPDGKYIATGSHDETVRVWDANTGQIIHLIKDYPITASSLAFTKNSDRLIISDHGGTVRYWDMVEKSMNTMCELGKVHTTTLALSPHDRHLLAGTSDMRDSAKNLLHLVEVDLDV